MPTPEEGYRVAMIDLWNFCRIWTAYRDGTSYLSPETGLSITPSWQEVIAAEAPMRLALRALAK